MIKGLYKMATNWSMFGSVYLISDTHFDDADCKLIDEKWPDPEDWIKELNKTLTKMDTLVVLGDVGNPEYFSKLKACHKVLIKGNHDKGDTNYAKFFDEIYGGPVFISDKICLSHEPLRLGDVAFNIHGHCHSTDWVDDYNQLNITSNIVGFKLLNLNTIIKSGITNKVCGIHRLTIDKASGR